MTPPRQRLMRPLDDAGIAMLTVVLVASLLMALGLTAVTVATRNLNGAGRDRVGGAALAAAEAGVAQGIEYIKTGSLTSPPCAAACAVALPDARSANVTIKVVQAYNPPIYRVGTFLITSVGIAGSGPGRRTLDVTVTVKPFGFPVGIFTESLTDFGGNGSVVTESIFSDACIDSRSKINFAGTDAFYNIAAGAHSTTYVNEQQDTGCKGGVAKSIHASSKCISSPDRRGDQDNGSATKDASGNPVSLTGTPCDGYTLSNSSNYTKQQLINDTGFVENGLTPGQYATLATIAKSTHHYYPPDPGNYYVEPCYSTCPAGQVPEATPVIYFNGYDLNKPSLADYTWQQDAACSKVQPSFIAVVRNGDMIFNGGRDYTAFLFAPDQPKGNVGMEGGATLHGTVFANSLKFTGGGYAELNACQVKAFPSPITDVQVSRFHERDR